MVPASYGISTFQLSSQYCIFQPQVQLYFHFQLDFLLPVLVYDKSSPDIFCSSPRCNALLYRDAMLYYIVLEYSMYSIWIVLTIMACGNGNTVALLTPGAGKIWGDFVTINPDPSTSRKQPWKCTRCHHKYGKTSANASRVAQHVCGRARNVSGCPGATIDDKNRFPTHFCLPPASSIPSSSTTACATSLVRPSPSSQKGPRERTEEDVVREAFGEKERQAFVTNRLEDVVPVNCWHNTILSCAVDENLQSISVLVNH